MEFEENYSDLELEKLEDFEDLSSIREVCQIIGYAKLDPSSLRSTIQQIKFTSASELNKSSIKLLELDSKTLEYVENGGKLIVKGTDTENCVLCTDNLTYEMKEAVVSDSLLLVEGLDPEPSSQTFCDNEDKIALEPVSITNVCRSYLELKTIKPKIGSLKLLLHQSLYKGPEYETEVTPLTRDEVYNSVNASRVEIDNALKSIDALELNGYIRLLDFDYTCRVLCSIIGVIEENSWKWDSFNEEHTVELLKDIYPACIVAHVLACYNSALVSDGDENRSLNEDKICRFFAELLLRPTKQFNKDEFLEAWRLSVPDGMVTSVAQLEGLSFFDSSSDPAVVRYFPESDLSDDVKERFAELFSAKDCWTADELKPYLQPLAIGKLTVSVLITKYARGFMKNGIKYYTSKYFS